VEKEAHEKAETQEKEDETKGSLKKRRLSDHVTIAHIVEYSKIAQSVVIN
jgi:hypothetical protein